MKNKLGSISLILGLLSVFLWDFSIIPLTAIILGGISLTQSQQTKTTKNNALWGLGLGLIFLIIKIYHIFN